MPKAIASFSLEEIQREALDSEKFFDETASKHPTWDWPAPMSAFARELKILASEVPLDCVRIHDFRVRIEAHIRSERLKGMEPFIWCAEGLESLAQKEGRSRPPENNARDVT